MPKSNCLSLIDSKLSRYVQLLSLSKSGPASTLNSFPWRARPYNPWFETISHKIMRLVAPWLLLALFLASAASRELGWLFWAQIAFYALAAAGKRAGKLGGVARTFVVLNASALLGLFRFVTGRQRITW